MIYKYKLEVTDRQTLAMPYRAKILSLQVQNGVPCIWAQVHAGTPEGRTFVTYGTGHAMPSDPGTYIGTYQTPENLVFHVFEEK